MAVPSLAIPTAKQRRSILQADARINLWHGSVRSSKTVASTLRWLDEVSTGPSGEAIIVGKTERTIKRNIINPIHEWLGEGVFNYKDGTGEGKLWGRTVYVVGANDSRSEGKIRGGTFANALVDEATLIPEDFWTMLLQRLSIEGARLFATTNTDAPMHWLKRNYLDRIDALNEAAREAGSPMPGMREFQFRLEDNPHLGRAYVASIKAEHQGLWYKRFIDGLWVLAEGAIWDIFDESLHVLDAVPEDVEITDHWVGVDYGTSNPFVALLLGLGSDGVIYVLDEYRWDSKAERRQKTDAQYSAAVDSWIQMQEVAPTSWYIDPSAASFKLQLRQDHGWPVREAWNEVLDGLRMVGMFLGNQKLAILRRCKGLIDEIGGYCWDPKAQERGEDKPLKTSDHGPDALRYGLFSHMKRSRWSAEDLGWVV